MLIGQNELCPKCVTALVDQANSLLLTVIKCNRNMDRLFTAFLSGKRRKIGKRQRNVCVKASIASTMKWKKCCKSLGDKIKSGQHSTEQLAVIYY